MKLPNVGVEPVLPIETASKWSCEIAHDMYSTPTTRPFHRSDGKHPDQREYHEDAATIDVNVLLYHRQLPVLLRDFTKTLLGWNEETSETFHCIASLIIIPSRLT